MIGASSGIGAELVKQLAAKGCKVAALARRMEPLQQLAQDANGKVLGFQHDVTDFASIPALFQEITKHLEGLDLVIYSAGVMPAVGEDEYDFEKDKSMIEVNVLGAIAWLNQAAIRFGNTGSGTIVAIGSVAGERGRAGQPVYNASKAALKTYMEALRNRLSKRGVTVVTIKAGPTQTPMTADLNLKNAMPAEKAASLILQKAGKPGEHYLSPVHQAAFAVIRNIPSPIFRKMKV